MYSKICFIHHLCNPFPCVIWILIFMLFWQFFDVFYTVLSDTLSIPTQNISPVHSDYTDFTVYKYFEVKCCRLIYAWYPSKTSKTNAITNKQGFLTFTNYHVRRISCIFSPNKTTIIHAIQNKQHNLTIATHLERSLLWTKTVWTR